MGQTEHPRFVVQRYDGIDPETARSRWIDIDALEAEDAGTALQRAMAHPNHQIKATTYRVTEEALTVNVSINLEAADV